MALLVVRHAHALARSTWEGDDRGRTLSAKGRLQAERLATALLEAKPERILSSPYRRCVETVEPLAEAAGVAVETSDALAEGAGREALDLVRRLCGLDAVVCSHGDVIPAVLAALAAEDGLDLGPEPAVQKASVWVLAADGGRYIQARYLAPPPV